MLPMLSAPELKREHRMIVVFNASLESVQMVAPEIELLDKYVLPAILKH
jgi:hypothetical protein